MCSISSLPCFQLDNAKAEVGRKDTELLAVKTQMEVLQRQQTDSHQHISVLKEQVFAKEKQHSENKSDVSPTNDAAFL